MYCIRISVVIAFAFVRIICQAAFEGPGPCAAQSSIIIFWRSAIYAVGGTPSQSAPAGLHPAVPPATGGPGMHAGGEALPPVAKPAVHVRHEVCQF